MRNYAENTILPDVSGNELVLILRMFRAKVEKLFLSETKTWKILRR
jgi:hypothetical protein